MSAPASGISIREFARRSNLDDKQVRRGIANGQIKPLPDGTLNPADVDTPWRKTVRRRGADKSKSSAAPMSARADKRPVETESPERAAERIVRELGVTMNLRQAETLKENYLALLRQLEYDMKSGAVVPVAEVAKLVAAEYAQVRTKLLAIPSERAPQIHRLKTVSEVQDALLAMIVEALDALTRDREAGQ